MVWVVYPVLRQVIAFTATRELRWFRREDELDGGAVLPGFRLPLSTLFPEEPTPPSPA